MDMIAAGQNVGAPLAADAAAPVRGVSATLESLDAMALSELRTVWVQHFGPAPALRSVELMRLVLAWRLQARTFGGLDTAVRRKLRRKAAIDAATAGLEPGSILVREWQGQRFEVAVEEEGFRWGDGTYASLSAVASAITGTRWNGPRFFGLRGDKP